MRRRVSGAHWWTWAIRTSLDTTMMLQGLPFLSDIHKTRYPKSRRRRGNLRCETCNLGPGTHLLYRVEMVDRYDEATGFTSMARTTAFTGAIVARMIGRGDLKTSGALSPEQAITGPLFDRLVAELAAVGVRLDVTMEKIEALGSG
jgi:hypothetical protein